MPELLIRDGLVRGGFAQAYRGVWERGPEDPDLDVAVHVTRVRFEPGSRDFERVWTEARLLAGLSHPALPRVHDVVQVDGRVALVTERAAGRDLAELIRGGGLPKRAVFEVIAQVGAALDAAWSTASKTDGKPVHLLHRGVQPGVIRIDPYGVVKLSDFALVPVHDPSTPLSAQGTTSIRYRAPEVLVRHWADPNPGGFTHESDVFALGCVLFEALVGQGLFSDLSAPEQRELMAERTRYRRLVERQLDAARQALGSDRALALLRVMTAFPKAERPSAAEVAARCDLISDSIPGPSLSAWCRDRSWPDPRAVGGPLVGTRLVLSGPSLADLAATERRPRRRPVSQADNRPTLPATPPANGWDLDRELVLGEDLLDPQPLHDDDVSAIASQGPTPYTPAEMVALFSMHTPSLAPQRARTPGEVVNPNRMPQLVRQRVDGVVAQRRRHSFAPARVPETDPSLVRPKVPTWAELEPEPVAQRPAGAPSSGRTGVVLDQDRQASPSRPSSTVDDDESPTEVFETQAPAIPPPRWDLPPTLGTRAPGAAAATADPSASDPEIEFRLEEPSGPLPPAFIVRDGPPPLDALPPPVFHQPRKRRRRAPPPADLPPPRLAPPPAPRPSPAALTTGAAAPEPDVEAIEPAPRVPIPPNDSGWQIPPPPPPPPAAAADEPEDDAQSPSMLVYVAAFAGLGLGLPAILLLAAALYLAGT